MGITKSDFIRGMQCPKMLWLDKHKPECKIIPPDVMRKLIGGNEFGDAMMGAFGPFVEVKEYYPNTTRPHLKRMAAKTAELIEAKTPVICEAAFLDPDGNYCAVDLLRYDAGNGCWDLIEVKNSKEVSETFLLDAAYQAALIRRTGLPLGKAFLLFHAEEPYAITEITEEVAARQQLIENEWPRLAAVKEDDDEILQSMGEQCHAPYECWYQKYCQLASTGKLAERRCRWAQHASSLMMLYHDTEWGIPCHDDAKLFESLFLEFFQAGLSWEIVLKKREAFRQAFDGFDPVAISRYTEEKLESLLNDPGIIRNRRKIEASVRNAKVFLAIQKEFGSFDRYLWSFSDGQVIYEPDLTVTTSPLSDEISKDLQRRGMNFVGSTVIYSFLQANGIVHAHSKDCFCYRGDLNGVQMTLESL